MAPRLTRRSRPEATTQSISNFTRVSKTNVPSPAGKKAVVEATTTSTPSPRKRKLADEADESSHPRAAPRTVSFAPSSDEEEAAVVSPRSKRACRRQQEPVLATKPTIASAAPSPKPVKGKKVAKTPTKTTTRKHKASEDTLLSKSNKSVQTKLDGIVVRRIAGSKQGSNTPSLPQHLSDLVELNKAFLRTISIQMAHNGSNVPIDFKAVSSDISLSWGKRQIKIEDLLRCVAVQSASEDGANASPFIVTDYGRGKVCIELGPSRQGSAAIDEARLIRQFEENLRALRPHRSQDRSAADDVADISLDNLSLADLPRADIVNRDLGIKAHPSLAKGSRVLSDLKMGLAAKQQVKETKQTAAPTLNPDGTKMSLLDRLRLKQLAKENGPVPLSGPELQRRAALNRVVDVSATISTLCLSNPYSLPRQSFTMAAIQDSLKDSLRVPISKDEAAAAVRLLASEVAPQWLRLVTIGGRENVLVQRDWQPGNRDIQQKVSQLLSV